MAIALVAFPPDDDGLPDDPWEFEPDPDETFRIDPDDDRKWDAFLLDEDDVDHWPDDFVRQRCQ